MSELAKEEIDELTRESIQLEKQLKILLLPRDPLDERNIMLEVAPGLSQQQCIQGLRLFREVLDPCSKLASCFHLHSCEDYIVLQADTFPRRNLLEDQPETDGKDWCSAVKLVHLSSYILYFQQKNHPPKKMASAGQSRYRRGRSSLVGS